MACRPSPIAGSGLKGPPGGTGGRAPLPRKLPRPRVRQLLWRLLEMRAWQAELRLQEARSPEELPVQCHGPVQQAEVRLGEGAGVGRVHRPPVLVPRWGLLAQLCRPLELQGGPGLSSS